MKSLLIAVIMQEVYTALKADIDLKQRGITIFSKVRPMSPLPYLTLECTDAEIHDTLAGSGFKLQLFCHYYTKEPSLIHLVDMMERVKNTLQDYEWQHTVHALKIQNAHFSTVSDGEIQYAKLGWEMWV